MFVSFFESKLCWFVDFDLFLKFMDLLIMDLFFNPLLSICGLFGFEVSFDGLLCFFEGFLFLLFLKFGFEFGHFFLAENVLLIELMKFFVKFLLFFEMGHFLFVLFCSLVHFDCLLQLLDLFVFFNQLVFELCEFILIV